MALHHRLRHLEKRLVPPPNEICDGCGLPLQSPPRRGRADIRVTWRGADEARPPDCPACGQTNVIWIEFDRAG
jgi:hypothetical protein